MAEVRPDDEMPGRMGFRTRSNHQNPAVRPPWRENSYIGGENWVLAPWMSRLSGKCPLDYFSAIFMDHIPMFVEINVNLTRNSKNA